VKNLKFRRAVFHEHKKGRALGQSRIEREDVDKPPCRLFLSYSHDDAGAMKELLMHLRRMFEDIDLRTATGLTMHEVFLDETRLSGINGWSAEIERQIDTCEVFIMLMSAYSFDPKSYCRQYELPRMMVRRSLPLIVTVHLEEIPRWDRQVVAGVGTLPECVALPKVGRFSPPKRRGDPMPWKEVVQELHDHLMVRCRRDVPPSPQDAPPPTVQAHARAQAHAAEPVAPALLPYLCDQGKLSNGYADEIDEWRRRPDAWALVLLFKGHCDDGLRSLGRRFRRDHLKPWLKGAPECLTIEWPVHGTRSDRVVVQVVAALCGLLELHDLDVAKDTLKEAAAAMVQKLGRLSCPLHVVSYLPGGDWADTAAGIKALLQFFDQVPVDVQGRRWLVIDLILESNQPGTLVGLAKKCRPARLRGAHLAELLEPEQVPLAPIEHWFRTYFPHASSQQQTAFLQNIGQPPLRMRAFAERVGWWMKTG
jgi:hypothetical protein